MNFARRILFGKQKSLRETANKWNRELRIQSSAVERHIDRLDDKEDDAKQDMIECVEQGNLPSLKLLAKQILIIRAGRRQFQKIKTQMMTISLKIDQQLMQLTIQKSFAASVEITKMMNRLCNIKQSSEMFKEMQHEMQQAGLIQDAFDDAIDETYDDVGEVEVEEEASTVIMEVTGKTLLEIEMVNNKLPTNNVTNNTELEQRVNRLINEQQKLMTSKNVK